MRKILRFLHFKYLYLYSIIYFISSYFFNGRLKSSGLYSILEEYLGIVVFPVLFVLILSPLFFFIKDRKKKMILDVKLHAFFILVISCLYIFIMHKLALPFTKEMADEKVIENFLNMSVYEYKIGFIASYLFYLVLKNIMYCYIYSGLGVLIFCTFFLITAKFIKIRICKIYHDYKEKKRIQREEQLLREQIAIKEALEKREADMKLKLEIEKENKIKERVEEVILNKELVLESYFIDEDENIDDIASENLEENEIKEIEKIEEKEIEKETKIEKRTEIEDDDEEFLKIINPDYVSVPKDKKVKEEIVKVKEETPVVDTIDEEIADFQLFDIKGSSDEEIDKELEEDIKNIKKERELLTIKNIGGEKDDTSF